MSLAQAHLSRHREGATSIGRSRPGVWSSLLAIALLGALGCATQLAPPPKADTQGTYHVGAPDRLKVTILPEPAILEEVTVRPDGMITIQLIGDVPAAGRTVEEIAADVEQRMSRFKRGANASVALTNTASTEVIMLGQVGKQSTFPLAKQTRVAEALAKVGGVNGLFGSKRGIRVIRSRGGETVVYRVNLNAIEKGDLRTNIVLAEGDIVVVPPTILARIGFALNALLFPIQPLIGVAQTVGGNLVTP